MTFQGRSSRPPRYERKGRLRSIFGPKIARPSTINLPGRIPDSPGVVGPTFSPKPRSTPRRLISTSWLLVCSSFQAVSSARTSCASKDLQCAPEGTSRAASAERAACILAVGLDRHCLERVPDVPGLEQFDRQPRFRMPAYSHCDSGPASSPICVTSSPRLRNHPIRTSGSLATLASRMIRPVASTTHGLALSNDTSIPAGAGRA
jgi:hypothetical protein